MRLRLRWFIPSMIMGWRYLLVLLFLILLLAFVVDGQALAAVLQTATFTSTFTDTPTDTPTSTFVPAVVTATLPILQDFSCPDELPVGWNTRTPVPDWLRDCGHCSFQLTANPTNTEIAYEGGDFYSPIGATFTPMGTLTETPTLAVTDTPTVTPVPEGAGFFVVWYEFPTFGPLHTRTVSVPGQYSGVVDIHVDQEHLETVVGYVWKWTDGGVGISTAEVYGSVSFPIGYKNQLGILARYSAYADSIWGSLGAFKVAIQEYAQSDPSIGYSGEPAYFGAETSPPEVVTDYQVPYSGSFQSLDPPSPYTVRHFIFGYVIYGIAPSNPYCQSVDGPMSGTPMPTEEVVDYWPEVSYGQMYCVGYPTIVLELPIIFNTWFGISDITIPGVEICFREMFIGDLQFFGVATISIMGLLLIGVGIMVVRWLLRSQ